ncbi:MAG: M15 family metallopeptidase, partial [Christensenellaceae bacterium]|nr:M15 family metallopeptidase [Christensenellaceae bacterium]
TVAVGFISGSFNSTIPDKDINNSLFVVNTEFRLAEEYVPSTSKITSGEVTRLVRDDMLNPLKELLRASKNEGAPLSIVSGYRSYRKQEEVFESKLEKVKSEEAALEYVALPGSSEHQLGLAADLSNNNWTGLNESFAKTRQGKWLDANAYKYGFIIRYMPDYVDVTGYNYEPWHVRYIGKEHSEKINSMNNIPLEWYVSLLRLNTYNSLLNDTIQTVEWNYPVSLKNLLNKNNLFVDKTSNTIKNYNIKDLISLEGTDIKLMPDAAIALKHMIDAAEIEGYLIVPTRAYKSLEAQDIDKDKFKSLEYESGLLVDLDIKDNPSKNFAKSDEFAWLKANCASFGFIIRYPEGKKQFTEVAEIPNTFRYIGNEAASYLNNNNLCLEEFNSEWNAYLSDYLTKGGKLNPFEPMPAISNTNINNFDITIESEKTKN